MTKVPGTVDFMPPEALSDSPEYGPPMDIFSFAGIVLHTFNQEWPHPSEQVQFDRTTRNRVALSEVERRQQYLSKMIGEAEVFRPLVEECLDDDPGVRPTIVAVCDRLQMSKDVYMKKSTKDVITLHEQVEELQGQVGLLNAQLNLDKSNRMKSEGDQLKQPLVSISLAVTVPTPVNVYPWSSLNMLVRDLVRMDSLT